MENNQDQSRQPKQEIKRLKEKELPEKLRKAVKDKEVYINKPAFNK